MQSSTQRCSGGARSLQLHAATPRNPWAKAAAQSQPSAMAPCSDESTGRKTWGSTWRDGRSLESTACMGSTFLRRSSPEEDTGLPSEAPPKAPPLQPQGAGAAPYPHAVPAPRAEPARAWGAAAKPKATGYKPGLGFAHVCAWQHNQAGLREAFILKICFLI